LTGKKRANYGDQVNSNNFDNLQMLISLIKSEKDSAGGQNQDTSHSHELSTSRPTQPMHGTVTPARTARGK
jgi:hypothetical protein